MAPPTASPRTREDEHVAILGEAGDDVEDDEDRRADHEHALAANAVGKHTEGDQQGGEDE